MCLCSRLLHIGWCEQPLYQPARTGVFADVWRHNLFQRQLQWQNMCARTKSLTPRRQTFNSLRAISTASASDWVCAVDHLATCFPLWQTLSSMYPAHGRRFPLRLASPRSIATTRTSQVSAHNAGYLPYCGCCQQPARLTVEPARRTVSILNYGVRSRDNPRSFSSGRYTKPTGSVCAELCQVCAQDESRLSFGRLERHSAGNARIRKYFQEVVCSHVWVTAVRRWQPTRDDGSPQSRADTRWQVMALLKQCFFKTLVSPRYLWSDVVVLCVFETE